MARPPIPDAPYSGRSTGALGATQSGRTAQGSGKLVIRLDDPTIKSILRNFNRMEKAANVDLKDLSRDISRYVAQELMSASMNHRWYPRQAARLAESIKVNRDRVPSITIGGSKRFTNSDGERKPYGDLLFINEFGSLPSYQQARFRNRFQRKNNSLGGFQGPPRSPKEGKGNRGYWIFPRLRRIQPTILRWWLEGAQEVADHWKDR